MLLRPKVLPGNPLNIVENKAIENTAYVLVLVAMTSSEPEWTYYV